MIDPNTIPENVPEYIRDAILTLGVYCRERDCADCVFVKNTEPYPNGCLFEQEHNPCWMVEDTLGDPGLEELYIRTKEKHNGTK